MRSGSGHDLPSTSVVPIYPIALPRYLGKGNRAIRYKRSHLLVPLPFAPFYLSEPPFGALTARKRLHYRSVEYLCILSASLIPALSLSDWKTKQYSQPQPFSNITIRLRSLVHDSLQYCPKFGLTTASTWTLTCLLYTSDAADD